MAASLIGGGPNRVLVIRDSTDPRKAKVFRAHAAPQGMCDNLINSLKLLTNQQKDGASPVDNLAARLLETCRRGIMDGLRKFIAVDNHEAVKVGGLHQDTKSFKVVKPKFTTDFLATVIREGADDLTLRAHEEGVLRTFIDTTKIEDQRWEPPLVDADWACFLPDHFPGN